MPIPSKQDKNNIWYDQHVIFSCISPSVCFKMMGCGVWCCCGVLRWCWWCWWQRWALLFFSALSLSSQLRQTSDAMDAIHCGLSGYRCNHRSINTRFLGTAVETRSSLVTLLCRFAPVYIYKKKRSLASSGLCCCCCCCHCPKHESPPSSINL